MKRCPRCKRDLPLTMFHRSKAKGVQCYCKTCSSAKKLEWLRANGPVERANKLWSVYRLRDENYQALRERQDHRCAACREPFTGTPHVDHDHACCPPGPKTGPRSCGKCVRGLVCVRCNTFIGYIEARPGSLEQVLAYLQQGAPPIPLSTAAKSPAPQAENAGSSPVGGTQLGRLMGRRTFAPVVHWLGHDAFTVENGGRNPVGVLHAWSRFLFGCLLDERGWCATMWFSPPRTTVAGAAWWLVSRRCSCPGALDFGLGLLRVWGGVARPPAV
jgi:hypothetical protein